MTYMCDVIRPECTCQCMIYVHIKLSTYVIVCLYACIPVCIWMFDCFPAYLYACLSVCRSVGRSLRPSVRLSVSVCLSVCPSACMHATCMLDVYMDLAHHSNPLRAFFVNKKHIQPKNEQAVLLNNKTYQRNKNTLAPINIDLEKKAKSYWKLTL